MKHVTVYSTPTCPACSHLKEYLAEKGVKYEEKNVAEDSQARNEMMSELKSSAVPTLKIGESIVIGFDKAKIDELLH